MPPPSAYHISYANGASCWTQKLSSAVWALYLPSHDLLHTNGICLGSTTNNQAEYTIIIGLLVEANHHHILHLSILLDSQLVILHLNNVYRVRDPCLFANTCRLDIYLDILIPLHLHISQDNSIK
jgi:ribonuclease HI